MTYSLVFVEGASDSALLTGAFQRLGFTPCRNLSAIPDSVSAHFPKTFPAAGDFLNRVNSYPEVLGNSKHHVAIINTGGIARLGNELKKATLLIKEELPLSVTAFVDSDNVAGADRFNEASSAIRENFIVLANERFGVGGISAPDQVGEIKEGAVNTGVYIWPGAGAPGTLERVVLEGIHAEFPDIFRLVHDVPRRVRDLHDINHNINKMLSSGFNIDKAELVMMGGAISPSASLSVYLSKESHRLDAFFSAPGLTRLLDFLKKFLPADAKLA